jgi:hypothetical protein
VRPLARRRSQPRPVITASGSDMVGPMPPRAHVRRRRWCADICDLGAVVGHCGWWYPGDHQDALSTDVSRTALSPGSGGRPDRRWRSPRRPRSWCARWGRGPLRPTADSASANRRAWRDLRPTLVMPSVHLPGRPARPPDARLAHPRPAACDARCARRTRSRGPATIDQSGQAGRSRQTETYRRRPPGRRPRWPTPRPR